MATFVLYIVSVEGNLHNWQTLFANRDFQWNFSK